MSHWSQQIEALDRQAEFERASQQRVFRLIQAMEAEDQAQADKILHLGLSLDTPLELTGPRSIPVPGAWLELVGVPTDAKQVLRLSALGWAAARDRSHWVNWLVDAEASIGLSLHQGKDAAWLAMERGHLTTTALLLGLGASPHLRLGVAPRITRLMGAVVNRQVTIVEALLRRGAKPTDFDDNWSTALHYNFKQDPYTDEDIKIARLLLDADADPLAEDRQGIQAGSLAKTDHQLALLEGYEIRKIIEPVQPAADPAAPDDILPGVPQLTRPYKKPRI